METLPLPTLTETSIVLREIHNLPLQLSTNIYFYLYPTRHGNATQGLTQRLAFYYHMIEPKMILTVTTSYTHTDRTQIIWQFGWRKQCVPGGPPPTAEPCHCLRPPLSNLFPDIL